MPKLLHTVPKYRRHKASGQAVVTFNGRDHYPGRHGSKSSREKYDRLLAEWLTVGKCVPPSTRIRSVFLWGALPAGRPDRAARSEALAGPRVHHAGRLLMVD